MFLRYIWDVQVLEGGDKEALLLSGIRNTDCNEPFGAMVSWAGSCIVTTR